MALEKAMHRLPTYSTSEIAVLSFVMIGWGTQTSDPIPLVFGGLLGIAAAAQYVTNR